MFCPACQSEYPDDWKACPKDATLLLRSNRIGKYTIDGLLGVGGMGAVYRATNPDTQARVAVKVLHPSVANAEAMRTRFQREAAAVAALRTSHVVKVFDFGTEPDGTLYLVMELLDGHALRSEITPAPSTMPLSRIQQILDGALKGLAAAHRAGIVHRDLKPENIFVADTDDGEVCKLLDFGIARVRTRDAELTKTGSLMGTASYMAPEQVSGNVSAMGPWTDVYAMGAILYEMLAGRPAIGGDTVSEVLQRAVTGELTPLAQVRPGLDASVYALVERCMSPAPEARPHDAEQMRALVAQTSFTASSSIIAAPIAPGRATTRSTPLTTPPMTTQPPTSERKRRAAPYAIAGIVAVAAIAGVVAYRLTRDPANAAAPIAQLEADAMVVVDAPQIELDAAVVAIADAGVLVVDAGVAQKPPPKPTKPPPKPGSAAPPDPPDATDADDKCDPVALRTKAQKRFEEGVFGVAIRIAQRAVDRCGSNDEQTIVIGASAACHARRAVIAKRFVAMLPPARAAAVRTICARQGTPLR